MNQYGVPIDYHLGGKKMSKRMRNILDTFYPEVKGDFNKLNTAELNKLTAMFSKDKDGNVIPSKVNMLPPDDIYIGELNPTWMKAVQWGNIPLPIYTILDAAGGRLSSNRMMALSFLKRKTLNLMQTFSKAFTDKVPERYLEILQKEIDPLFKEARTGEHAKTVEKMKNKMIKVPVPEFEASGKVFSKTSIMSEYNYTKMLLQNLNDKIAMEKSRHRVEVQNSRIEGDRGKNDFLEVYGRVTDDKGKVVKKPDGSIETVRIDLKRVHDQDLIKILTGEHRKGSKIQVAGKEKLEPMVIDKVANNHYEPNYFYRMLTQEFFDLIQSDKDGLRGHVVNSIMKKNPTMSKAEAKKQLKIKYSYSKRYKRLKERLSGWALDDIIMKAALIGAQYGYEWADQFEVAEGIIECNSLGIAEKVADELEDSIPEPRNDTAERAATILAFIKKREADPNYKPTVEEAKLIRPLEPKEKP